MQMRTCVFALAVVSFPAWAADYTVRLTPEQTKIEWTLGAALHTVHGTFKLKRGVVQFDPDSGKASGEVVIDLTSGESGNESRDKDMHKKVLETGRYPEAVFTPDRIDGKPALPGTSTAKLHGTFNIHGAAHELTLDVQAKTTTDEAIADLTFTIPYVQWGMKDPSNFLLRVSKTVQVTIHATGSLQH